ncbi:acVLRF1 family peptidyl-tRNA hydrolase [Microtetraspora malaysiensis]|uniref:acVLRF1 family peptidyl-tRNA hydrolase n=1 Tax=Microtetraspora malaysiensis TaxID=161358 RepID=UPI0009FEF051|nr:acVLRF1 family peptidyl-tRNA hydrolase [Microtetraspora malaysiensis]
MTARPAAGGGRWVTVAPERVERWADGFAARHGGAEAIVTPDLVRLTAADGAVAELHVPFPPLMLAEALEQAAIRAVEPEGGARRDLARVADQGAGHGVGADTEHSEAALGDPVAALAVHARRDRLVGVLLVRLGGHAAGVFDGERLVASKVGSRQVHGRSAAGGWSQQRFARRREKQSAEALEAAADVAARVLLPYAGELEAVVLGGDRRAIDSVRRDRRLAPLLALEQPPFLTVPDPRLAVLRETPATFRAVRVRVVG